MVEVQEEAIEGVEVVMGLDMVVVHILLWTKKTHPMQCEILEHQ